MMILKLCKIPYILPIISKDTSNEKTRSPKAMSTAGKDEEVKEFKGFLATANVYWTHTTVVLYFIYFSHLSHEETLFETCRQVKDGPGSCD